MGKEYEGMLLGEGLRFGLVVSRFNEFVTAKLLEGARDALSRHGVGEEDAEVAWTPGSFELPAINGKIGKAYLLGDPAHKPLTLRQETGKVVVILPPEAPDKMDSVFVLEVS